MYSSQVLDHFEHPRNAGELSDATATVELENPVCGDVMKLAARVEGGRVVAVRFLTRGCTTAIACGSLLTVWMEGKTPEELKDITAQKISEELGGLPPATRHGAQLAAESLHALLSQLNKVN